jgi:D-alanyl-D-alanine carboxypeptidase
VPDVDIPDAITIARLLVHTSGLADYGDLSSYHADVRAHPGQPWTRAEFLDAVLPRGLLFEPGSGWSYSNIGYMLLIDAIERVSGASFADAVRRFIGEPLGLSKTRVVERLDDLLVCEAGFGSEVSVDGSIVDVRGIYHPGWCAPRLVVSTGRELTTIFASLFAGRLLSRTSMHQMLSMVPLPEPDGAMPSIYGGAGIYHDTASRFGRNLHHGGGGPGYEIRVTTYLDVPGGPMTVAVFVNTSTRPGEAEQHELTRVAVLDPR